MEEIINQCCYTHIGSWTTIAQKGIFEQLYIGELSRHSTFTDHEFKNALSVFETVGYGDKFLIMRTQYGLRDLSTVSKRDSMFSHGYLLDTSGDSFDPNAFLTIAKGNFCTNEADASKEKTCFQRIENFTIKTATTIAGLNRESLSKLIKCVYQLSVRSVNKQALFIKSKDEKQSLALLYCIYSALMPRYSKFLSSASIEYNFSDMRNIVFTKAVNTSRKYFIPETGENNVLSVNVKKNIDSLYFVDYGVKNFDTAERIQEYYIELEQTLTKISDTKQIDDNALKLAHIMTADPEPSKDSDIVSSDDTLMAVLKFAAEYNTNGNEFVKQYIEKLRSEGIRRGLIKVASPKPIATKVNPVADGFESIDTTGKRQGDSISFAENKLRKPVINAGNYKPNICVVSRKSNPAVRVGNGNLFSDNSVSSRHSSFSDDEFSEYGYRIKPLSSVEKQKLKKELEKIAKGGAKSIFIFNKEVEEIIRQERTITDTHPRYEYVKMIYDTLSTMISISMCQSDEKFYPYNPLTYFEKWCNSLGIPYLEIEKFKYQLIIKYWKNFNWANFTLLKREDYGYFRISERNCAEYPETNKELIAISNFVNCLSGLTQNMGGFERTEDWLIEFNKLCCKFRYTNYDTGAVNRVITSYYTKNIVSNNDNFFKDEYMQKNVISLAIVLSETEFNKCIKALRSFYVLMMIPGKISKKEEKLLEEKFLVSCKDFVSMQYVLIEVKEWAFKLTYGFFSYFDRNGYTVPFDYWLILGEIYSESPFKIFYDEKIEYHPTVMDMSVTEIVRDSRLLEYEYYRDILLNNERKNKSSFIRKLIKEIEDDNTGHKGKLKKRLWGINK